TAQIRCNGCPTAASRPGHDDFPAAASRPGHDDFPAAASRPGHDDFPTAASRPGHDEYLAGKVADTFFDWRGDFKKPGVTTRQTHVVPGDFEITTVTPMGAPAVASDPSFLVVVPAD